MRFPMSPWRTEAITSATGCGQREQLLTIFQHPATVFGVAGDPPVFRFFAAGQTRASKALMIYVNQEFRRSCWPIVVRISARQSRRLGRKGSSDAAERIVCVRRTGKKER